MHKLYYFFPILNGGAFTGALDGIKRTSEYHIHNFYVQSAAFRSAVDRRVLIGLLWPKYNLKVFYGQETIFDFHEYTLQVLFEYSILFSET